MSEEMSGIDRYRAQWKPNKRVVRNLNAMLRRAEKRGDLLAQIGILGALREALRPPRNLPIKRLV